MIFVTRVDVLVLSSVLALTSACSDEAASSAEDASVAHDMASAVDANVAEDANVAVDMTTPIDAGVDAAEDANVAVDMTTPIDTGVDAAEDAAEPDAAAPAATTLVASVPELALTVSGTSRIVIVTNIGTEAAFDVSLGVSTALPSGTTQTSTCGSTLAPSASCRVEIVPGATPSSAPGLASTPSTVAIAGSNTNSVTVNIHVLDYGNIYQGGFVFAIDDTTPNTGSIGGKVAATRDQALPFPSGVLFSATAGGGGTTPSYDNIPGIDETATPLSGGCRGNTDGACNSNQIRTFYSPPNTDPGVPLFYYAAGVCAATIDGYSDWYLPAICELGYDETGSGNGCGTSASPTIDNMQSNLVDNGVGGLSGFMWSSTAYSASPATQAWSQTFAIGGASGQSTSSKSGALSIRCARALTY